MGRKKINYEFVTSRFPERTLERINGALEEGETQAEFIRQAVATELMVREANVTVRKRKAAMSSKVIKEGFAEIFARMRQKQQQTN